MARQKYDVLCEELLAAIGGKNNMVSALHCETRLRFYVKDRSLVDKEKVNRIKGVLGSQFVGDQFQVIIGQHVHDVYADLCKVAGVEEEKQIDEKLDTLPAANKKSIKYWFDKIVMDVISGCIMPILPIFVSAGIIKMIATIIGPNLLGIFSSESDGNYQPQSFRRGNFADQYLDQGLWFFHGIDSGSLLTDSSADWTTKFSICRQNSAALEG